LHLISSTKLNTHYLTLKMLNGSAHRKMTRNITFTDYDKKSEESERFSKIFCLMLDIPKQIIESLANDTYTIEVRNSATKVAKKPLYGVLYDGRILSYIG
jgi:hypothetical protein